MAVDRGRRRAGCSRRRRRGRLRVRPHPERRDREGHPRGLDPDRRPHGRPGASAAEREVQGPAPADHPDLQGRAPRSDRETGAGARGRRRARRPGAGAEPQGLVRLTRLARAHGRTSGRRPPATRHVLQIRGQSDARAHRESRRAPSSQRNADAELRRTCDPRRQERRRGEAGAPPLADPAFPAHAEHQTLVQGPAPRGHPRGDHCDAAQGLPVLHHDRPRGTSRSASTGRSGSLGAIRSRSGRQDWRPRRASTPFRTSR